MAGLPIVTTYQCGAGTDLLIDGFNGHKYNATDTAALSEIIKKIATQTSQDYFEMSRNSKRLAAHIDLAGWSAHINTLKAHA